MKKLYAIIILSITTIRLCALEVPINTAVYTQYYSAQIPVSDSLWRSFAIGDMYYFFQHNSGNISQAVYMKDTTHILWQIYTSTANGDVHTYTLNRPFSVQPDSSYNNVGIAGVAIFYVHLHKILSTSSYTNFSLQLILQTHITTQ